MSIKSTASNHSLPQFWTSVVPFHGCKKPVLCLQALPYWPYQQKLRFPFGLSIQLCKVLRSLPLGSLYGRHLGVATVLLYLFEGAIGLPVFTGVPGFGLAYMAGPTAGFLLGFILAAYVSGALVERGWGKSIAGALAVFICGDLALYVPGVLWLMYLVGIEATLNNLVAWLPALLVKEFLGAASLPIVSPFLRRSAQD
jgi:biotin transport system substrate-specific component